MENQKLNVPINFSRKRLINEDEVYQLMRKGYTLKEIQDYFRRKQQQRK